MSFIVEPIETRAPIKTAASGSNLLDVVTFCGTGLLVSIVAATWSWLLQVPGPMF